MSSAEQHHFIGSLVERALDAFWQTIVARYPSATTGDLSPLATLGLDEAARCAVAEWIANNVLEGDPPAETPASNGIDHTTRSPTRSFRVHLRELEYYQSFVEAENAAEAIRMVRESPPDMRFIASEDRDAFGVDELLSDNSWSPLPDAVIDDA